MLMPAMRAIFAYRSPSGAEKPRILSVIELITKLTLPLLVARIRRADHVNHPPTANDLAVLADLLDRRSNFHD
jgi:hypothetical protein